MKELESFFLKRKIVVTCGIGGVGKTTLSAALAVRAALSGRNAVVVTIDPAKRLATSLGLDPSQAAQGDLLDITPELLRAAKNAGAPTQKMGSLHALVPDARLTFENFVQGLADTEEARRKITENPIFQIFAREFSGANDYMAMESLHKLAQTSRFDLIVLDTPPSRDTLSFLKAPELLSRFFDDKLVNWLALPANKLVAGGVRKALGLLEKLTGGKFMTHLFDFAASIFEVRIRFAASLKKITALLSSEKVGFLLVATPDVATRRDTAHFIDSVRQLGFQFDGLALNRTLGYLPTESPEGGPNEGSKEGSMDAPKEPREAEAMKAVEWLRQQEKISLQDVFPLLGPSAIHAVLPELARDIHSLEDLIHVAMAFNPA